MFRIYETRFPDLYCLHPVKNAKAQRLDRCELGRMDVRGNALTTSKEVVEHPFPLTDLLPVGSPSSG